MATPRTTTERPLIDLRSDTLTKPTLAMREAMASAEVGDAYYDEDPTVLALESRVAALFGHEAALFVPSGTMGNQICVRLFCQPGDGLVIPLDNHIVRYETGALAGVSGVNAVEPALENGFQISPGQLARALIPFEATYGPQTTLVAVENTHLKSGGRIYPLDRLRALAAETRSLGLPLHMDGARVWHAAVATGTPLRDYGELCQSLSVCFSKGLGAPVGSCVVSSRAHVTRAKRIRKMLGGSMRQCGIIAAGALHALENHVDRLSEDHANAKRLASFLRKLYPRETVPEPETNIVLLRLRQESEEKQTEVLARLERDFGLRMSALDPWTIRAVTHLDCDFTQFSFG